MYDGGGKHNDIENERKRQNPDLQYPSSSKELYDLPLELLDIILQKSYLHWIIYSATKQRDEVVIRSLTSVDVYFCRRITRRRFKKAIGRYLKVNYSEERVVEQELYNWQHMNDVEKFKRDPLNDLSTSAAASDDNKVPRTFNGDQIYEDLSLDDDLCHLPPLETRPAEELHNSQHLYGVVTLKADRVKMDPPNDLSTSAAASDDNQVPRTFKGEQAGDDSCRLPPQETRPAEELHNFEDLYGVVTPKADRVKMDPPNDPSTSAAASDDDQVPSTFNVDQSRFPPLETTV